MLKSKTTFIEEMEKIFPLENLKITKRIMLAWPMKIAVAMNFLCTFWIRMMLEKSLLEPTKLTKESPQWETSFSTFFAKHYRKWLCQAKSASLKLAFEKSKANTGCKILKNSNIFDVAKIVCIKEAISTRHNDFTKCL